MSKVIEGLRYSRSHEWVKVEGEFALIGISDFAQKELGDITYADIPEVDTELEVEEVFGALESVKASSELISPVSGVVVEVNEKLADAPELINEDPYSAWIVKVRLTSPSEVETLLDSESYKKLIEE